MNELLLNDLQKKYYAETGDTPNSYAYTQWLENQLELKEQQNKQDLEDILYELQEIEAQHHYRPSGFDKINGMFKELKNEIQIKLISITIQSEGK